MRPNWASAPFIKRNIIIIIRYISLLIIMIVYSKVLLLEETNVPLQIAQRSRTL